MKGACEMWLLKITKRRKQNGCENKLKKLPREEKPSLLNTKISGSNLIKNFRGMLQETRSSTMTTTTVKTLMMGSDMEKQGKGFKKISGKRSKFWEKSGKRKR